MTDRDIALRVVAAGRDPESTKVGEIASREVVTLSPDDDLDDALELMAREKVRRLPIVVREDELVGVLSQADVAQSAKEKQVGEVVEAISQAPRGPRVTGEQVDGRSARTAATNERPGVQRQRDRRAPQGRDRRGSAGRGQRQGLLRHVQGDRCDGPAPCRRQRELGEPADPTAGRRSRHRVRPHLVEGELESGTVEALRSAAALLRSKAPDELGCYRAFVLDLARSVSSAADGGDEAEAAAIAKIEQALDEGQNA